MRLRLHERGSRRGDRSPAADATVEDIAAADAAPEYADSINILVYPDYLSEDVLASFEQEYGIAVNITYLSYGEDNITRVESGDDFDVINPCQGDRPPDASGKPPQPHQQGQHPQSRQPLR